MASDKEYDVPQEYEAIYSRSNYGTYYYVINTRRKITQREANAIFAGAKNIIHSSSRRRWIVLKYVLIAQFGYQEIGMSKGESMRAIVKHPRKKGQLQVDPRY